MHGLEPVRQLSGGSGGPGWLAFCDPQQYLHYGLVLLLATATGTLLAYHPVYRRRGVTLETLELRKTMIVYSVVGALVALVCSAAPSMAFVIFGIGGLMRFRTDTGTSKATGHTIVATLIGLCWGLGLVLAATLATVFVWLLTYALEASGIVQLNVGGVAIADMARAAEAYRDAVTRSGGAVLGHSKHFKSGQMRFVLRLPRATNPEQLNQQLATLVPEPLRGTPDFID
jgi:hypothetical protein